MSCVFNSALSRIWLSWTAVSDDDDLTRIFNLMYELQTIQRPSASLLIGARAR